MTQAPTITREIPTYRIGEIVANVEKINRRFARHGQEGFRLVLGEKRITKIDAQADDGQLFRRTVELQTISLTGPTLRVQSENGGQFRFIGKVDHQASGNKEWRNVVVSLPGESVPESYRTAAPHCDHCNTQRYRLDTFIVRDQGDNIRQIGRNCLADYLGHNPENILAGFSALSKIVSSLDEEAEGWRGHGFTYGASALDVLAFTNAVVGKLGWTAKKDESLELGRASTAHLVENMMFGKNIKDRIVPTDKDFEVAEKALDYLNNTLADKTNKSEYEYNLTTITLRGFVEIKYFGFVASGLIVYNRFVERQIARQNAPKTDSHHFGTIGKRADVQVTVLRRHSFEGQFGLTTVYGMRTDCGADLVWFASGDGHSLERGRRYLVRLTVKRHQSNRETGKPETMVNRVSVINPLPDQNEAGNAMAAPAEVAGRHACNDQAESGEHMKRAA